LPDEARLLQQKQIFVLPELNWARGVVQPKCLSFRTRLNSKEEAADREVAIPPHFTPRLSRKKRLSPAAKD
jgi:hypothetical protein